MTLHPLRHERARHGHPQALGPRVVEGRPRERAADATPFGRLGHYGVLQFDRPPVGARVLEKRGARIGLNGEPMRLLAVLDLHADVAHRPYFLIAAISRSRGSAYTRRSLMPVI